MSSTLHLKNGVWASGHSGAVSFPEHGHKKCYDVEDRSFWFQHRNDCIVATVRRFPPCGTILDVGGGNGYVTRRLLDEGFDAVLLEPGEVGAANAHRNRAIPDVVCSTLEEAGFAPGSFAGAGVFDVIEHVDNDSAFVAHLHRLLIPGGLLYGTVPAHAWLWSLSDVAAGHMRRYTRSSIVRLLAGRFEMLYATCLFAPLVVPILLARTFPYRLGRRAQPTLSTSSEHGSGGGPLVSVLRAMLKKDVDRIGRAEESYIGTSVLFVARRR